MSGWSVVDYELGNNTITSAVQYEPQPHTCPACGQEVKHATVALAVIMNTNKRNADRIAKEIAYALNVRRITP